MNRVLLSLALLCACQSVFSQTKIFVDVAAVARITGDRGSDLQAGIYFEKKIGLNLGLGSGVRFLRYSYLEPIEMGDDFYQPMGAYFGVPVEFNYYISPKIQIKTFASILFYSRSLSNPVGYRDFSTGVDVIIPSPSYERTIEKIDFDFGVSGSYTVSRRFKIAFGVTYAMLLRKRQEVSDEGFYFDPDHDRMALSLHFLLFRLKKKRI